MLHSAVQSKRVCQKEKMRGHVPDSPPGEWACLGKPERDQTAQRGLSSRYR